MMFDFCQEDVNVNSGISYFCLTEKTVSQPLNGISIPIEKNKQLFTTIIGIGG